MANRSLADDKVLEPTRADSCGSEALPGLIGQSRAMKRVYAVAQQIAASRTTVLVTGDTGTGKGQLARALHALSGRAAGPFVHMHCASFAETLLESELFGHERGAFTGADRRRIGHFEQAHGGTAFLDEIAELSPSVQVKLLRVLQERTLERVGGNAAITVDVRVIAATNRDLGALVAEGKFREDLFYRLDVVEIAMPPLRTRGDDVLLLAIAFARRFSRDAGKHIEGFTASAIDKLRDHEWPGNVRELENTIERAVAFCAGSLVDEGDLVLHPGGGAPSAVRIPGATMQEIERHAILTTFDATGGSTTKTAEVLGISPRTVQYRLVEYGVRSGARRVPSRD